MLTRSLWVPYVQSRASAEREIMKTDVIYKARQFKLSGLTRISDKTLQTPSKPYERYVEQTNLLNEKISEFLKDGKVDQDETPAYSEITRRLGFEYNGMVL